jgi:hypothetical protein
MQQATARQRDLRGWIIKTNVTRAFYKNFVVSGIAQREKEWGG